MILALAGPAAAQPMNDAGSPWRGLYLNLGGHVGEMFGGNKLSFEDLSSGHDLSFTTDNPGSSTVLGGAELGQWWPMGGAVIGLESDVSFAKNIKYLSSLRGQIGVPAGSFLFYGSGGLGIEIADETFSVSSASGEVDQFTGEQKKYGWVAGGGVQVLLTPRLSLGVEGLYYGLGHDSSSLQTVMGAEPFNVVADRNFAVVRARIDFHFTNFW